MQKNNVRAYFFILTLKTTNAQGVILGIAACGFI